MKVAGVVAEYNSFHNGHKYHLLETKKQTGADYIIVVMSGNFVQRGEPAIINKYARTRAALGAGADLILELPVIYSTASAEYFALGAVSLLNNLGLVDYICFGSEHGDINSLSDLASYLLLNETEYNKSIKESMKKGVSFPKARQEAIKKNKPGINDSIISSPNNILGIEYIKALLQINSKIEPIAISRKQAQYHEASLNITTNKKDSNISSATSIRNAIRENSSVEFLKSHMPKKSYEILENEYNKTFPIYQNDFSLILKYKILQESSESLSSYIDVSKDLANRIKNTDITDHEFTSFAKEVQSKQWTLTRINRVLIHILLNLKNENFDLYNKNNYCQYAKVLGFKKEASKLLQLINKNTAIPIITKMSSAPTDLPSLGLQMLKEDIFAADLYNMVIYEKFGTSLPNEFRSRLVII